MEGIIASRVAQAVATQKEAWMKECQAAPTTAKLVTKATTADASKVLLDRAKVGNYMSTIGLVSKNNLTAALDLGVPLDPASKLGSTHATVFYMRPPHNDESLRGQVVSFDDDAGAALASCDTLHVLLSDHSGQRQQCLAIVPNYESFYLQRYMRINPKTHKATSNDASQPLQLVGRGLKANGRNEFQPVTTDTAQKAVAMLKTYFASLDDVLAELKVILERIAIQKTVIVMVCNFGQSELLLNFLCQARARNFDISNLLVFATDQETYDMATGMGVAAYFDKRVRA